MYETRCQRCRRGSLLTNTLYTWRHHPIRNVGRVRFCWSCGFRQYRYSRRTKYDQHIDNSIAKTLRKK